MKNKTLMKCGHVAMAVNDNNDPVCPICIGFNDMALITTTVDLSGRKAKCDCCNNKADSNINLPFFEYQSNKQLDSYYCGCKGWN